MMAAMTGSAEERMQAASTRLADQEDYLRSMRYLTDQELLSQLRESIRAEKRVLYSWAATGEFFIISAAGKIHLPNCPSMRRVIDRDAAWAPYLNHLDRVRDWHGSDNAPAMPNLLTRQQVEALRRYTACPVCAPTLNHPDKRPGVRGWTTLKAGSLKSHHFGTSFSLEDGTELGALIRITTVETIDGRDFAAEFDGQATPVTDPVTLVRYKTKIRTY